MTQAPEAAIDVVYTWVDADFPGYSDQLNAYADDHHDLNPNRYRDNIDILRFNLRSLSRYVPWVRHVYLVTCRPQVPAWLNTDYDGLTVIHHDEFIPNDRLPTFSSLSILAHLPRIKGLSDRFLYLCDDILFAAPAERAHYETCDGRIRVYERLSRTCGAIHRHRDDISPWNAAIAHSNHLLDEAFGTARRRHVYYVPLLIEKAIWREMIDRWPDDFANTMTSRFRAKYSAVPEYLYPYLLLYTGRGAPVSSVETNLTTAYASLENNPLVALWGRALIRALGPRSFTLNDNFGETPDPRVVAQTRKWLESLYPDKSPFER